MSRTEFLKGEGLILSLGLTNPAWKWLWCHFLLWMRQ